MRLQENDIIRTTYGLGPYQIEQITMRGQLMDLVCRDLREDVQATIHLIDYELQPDGNWKRRNLNEHIIFIERPAPRPGTQFDLFDL